MQIQNVISRADFEDLQEILNLQYVSYQKQGALFSKPIPPLTQTLAEVIEEYKNGTVFKMTDENGRIIGSIRTSEQNGTVHIGKLMVHPDFWHQGLGTRLLYEVENQFPGKRYELFTSTRSADNIRLYKRIGYKEFSREKIDDELEFIHMEKHG